MGLVGVVGLSRGVWALMYQGMCVQACQRCIHHIARFLLQSGTLSATKLAEPEVSFL